MMQGFAAGRNVPGSTESQMNSAVTRALESTIRFRIDRAGYLKQYETVFLQPIIEGCNAVAVGNGDLAAVAWQPGHLTWMLNKCDIGGAASQAARLTIETPDPIATRIGRLETRLSLAEAAATVTYTGGLLPQAASWNWRGQTLSKPLSVADKDRGSVRARFYVPNGRNVFLLSYDEEAETPHPVKFIFERWIQKEYGDKVTLAVRGNTLAIAYAIAEPDCAASYAAVLAFDGFAGAALSQASPLRAEIAIPAGAKISGRVAIAVVTSLEAENPIEEATRLAVATLKEPADKIWTQHLGWWNDFWGRLFVDAGQPYLNALYHMSLYELGISSRGKRPVKFNGALNLWDENTRMWGAPYWRHNQTETYLQCYAANQVELADNFHDWIAAVRPEAVKAARKYFQVDGAYYPEVMNHNFTVADPEKSVKPDGIDYILSCGVEYALMLWNRYTYSLDKSFLAEKAYPVIRDVAEFYVGYGKLGPDGLYHVSPALCWEELPLGRDTHSDASAWRAVFAVAVEAAGILGVDKEKQPAWKDRLAKAPPYPVSDGMFSTVWRDDGTPSPVDHFQWGLPNISGIFPYGVIGLDSPAALRKIAAETLSRYRFNADAGHEFLPVAAARLGNAEWWRAVMFQYIQYFQVFDQGLLHYYNIYGQKEIGPGVASAGMHPYLEASGILGTAVNEMLLQSYDGKIRVFPAVPARWPARFILRAAGSFLVASEHRGKAGIPYIAVQPVGGEPRTCSVVVPWDQGADLLEGGKRVTPAVKQGVAAFSVKPGVVYVLLPSGARLEDVPMVEAGFQKHYSPARLGNVWYGRPDGPNCHTTDFPLW